MKYQPTTFARLFTAAVYDLTQENLARNPEGEFTRQLGMITPQGLELEAVATLAQEWVVRAGGARRAPAGRHRLGNAGNRRGPGPYATRRLPPPPPN